MNERQEFFRVEVPFGHAPAGADYQPPGRASDRFTHVSLSGALHALTTGLSLGAVLAAISLTTPAFASEARIRSDGGERARSVDSSTVPAVIRHQKAVDVDEQDVFSRAQDLDGFADFLRAAPDADSVDDLI